MHRSTARFQRTVLSIFLAAGCSLLLSSCQKAEEVIVISEVRTLPEDERSPKLDATSRDRFRFSPAQMQAAASQRQAQATAPRLAWDTPSGWEQVSGNPMRQADFRFGPEQQGEIYVTRSGGSLLANLNRWREQMAQEELSDEEITSLPRRSIFGMEAVLVSIEGSYKAVGSDSRKDGYRLLGAILSVPNTDVSLFVKMIGPVAEVGANEEKFHAFCDSLRIEST